MMLFTDSEPGLKLSVPLRDSVYERTFAAEMDVLTENELLLRGAMQDHRLAVSHVWRVRTPDYEVLEATAQHDHGKAETCAPELCERYTNIAGVRVGRGFTKRILTALGDLPGASEHLFLAIEMARAAQQIYQFPPEFEAQFPPIVGTSGHAAFVSWQKDRAYMSDLANSCHTYRDASEELFRTREVRCGFDPSITRPQPGEKRVFWRNKRLTMRATSTGGFACESAMQDRVHDILIRFEITANGDIASAWSRGLRLPYHGICEEAQARTTALNGMRVTADYLRQFAEHVGGASGCTHLFDLSMDCLRLFCFAP